MCSLKSIPERIMWKAKLVERRFEEFGVNIQTDSLNFAQESLSLIMVVMAQCQWKLHFLWTSKLHSCKNYGEREVYIKPLREKKNSNEIWQLECVYGLSDASLQIGQDWK